VWHAQYVPCFQDITNYEDMLAWLENRSTALSNEELWGEQKSSYHFTNLKEWLEKRKTVNRKEKAKGRAKKVSNKTDESSTSKKKK
jgi:hypothetical protein